MNPEIGSDFKLNCITSDSISGFPAEFIFDKKILLQDKYNLQRQCVETKLEKKKLELQNLRSIARQLGCVIPFDKKEKCIPFYRNV